MLNLWFNPPLPPLIAHQHHLSSHNNLNDISWNFWCFRGIGSLTKPTIGQLKIFLIMHLLKFWRYIAVYYCIVHAWNVGFVWYRVPGIVCCTLTLSFTRSLGALRALTSAGGPSGLLTSSFAPFGRSGRCVRPAWGQACLRSGPLEVRPANFWDFWDCQ